MFRFHSGHGSRLRPLLIGAVAVALPLASCGKAVPKRTTPPPPEVATSLATVGTVRPTESLPGLIAPYQNVAIQSTLTEPADAVNVREGDHVARGEVLAVLDTADLQATLAADLAQANSDAASATHTAYAGNLSITQSEQSVRGATAGVRQAQETLARDTVDLERYRQLLIHGYISAQQVAQQTALVSNDQQAVRSTQANLSSNISAQQANGPNLQAPGLQSSSVAQARATEQVALAQAQQVRTQIAKATIVSPIDGVVVNRNLNPGEYPGTRQLFTLQQTDPVYAVLRGSGAQVADIADGTTARISASDVSHTALRGRVVGVLNQINPGSTDFQVKVLLPNATGKLRPGMVVAGDVVLPAVRGVRIPETAFTSDSHDAVMIVDKHDTVRTKTVALMADDGRQAVVTGLGAGTRVVADGQTSVGDGQRVAVR